MTGSAHVVAGNAQARLGALYGLPEVDVHHIFEIFALLRLGLTLGGAAAAEELRKDVAEPAGFRGAAAACARGAREQVGKIEPAEIHSGLRAAAGALPSGPCSGEAVLRIEPVLVVHLTL